jgi:hypothetical protein
MLRIGSCCAFLTIALTGCFGIWAPEINEKSWVGQYAVIDAKSGTLKNLSRMSRLEDGQIAGIDLAQNRFFTFNPDPVPPSGRVSDESAHESHPTLKTFTMKGQCVGQKDFSGMGSWPGKFALSPNCDKIVYEEVKSVEVDAKNESFLFAGQKEDIFKIRLYSVKQNSDELILSDYAGHLGWRSGLDALYWVSEDVFVMGFDEHASFNYKCSIIQCTLPEKKKEVLLSAGPDKAYYHICSVSPVHTYLEIAEWKEGEEGEEARQDQSYLFNIKTKKLIPVDLDEVILAWAPDDKSLVCKRQGQYALFVIESQQYVPLDALKDKDWINMWFLDNNFLIAEERSSKTTFTNSLYTFNIQKKKLTKRFAENQWDDIVPVGDGRRALVMYK